MCWTPSPPFSDGKLRWTNKAWRPVKRWPHLNCLIYRGEVKAEPGSDGVTLYSLAS
jgi:hypothetical protein